MVSRCISYSGVRIKGSVLPQIFSPTFLVQGMAHHPSNEIRVVNFRRKLSERLGRALVRRRGLAKRLAKLPRQFLEPVIGHRKLDRLDRIGVAAETSAPLSRGRIGRGPNDAVWPFARDGHHGHMSEFAILSGGSDHVLKVSFDRRF